MVEYLDLIKTLSNKNEDASKVIETIEYLYLNYVTHPFKFISLSEPYRIAKDIVRIEDMLYDKGNIVTLKIKSHNLLSDNRLITILKGGETRPDDIAYIMNQIIKPRRYFVSAAFIASVINAQYRRNMIKSVITVILTILSIIATVMAAIISNQLRD